MNSPAVDIKDYLLQQSALSASTLELVFGTNLFVGILPETSVITTMITDTAGSPAEPNDIHRSVIQVLSRGLKGEYGNGYSKISEIIEELHELANTTIGGTKYIQVWITTEITFVGNDTKDRPVFSCSLVVQKAI